MSTTSGRWARDNVSPFGLPRLWLRTRPVARTARWATVRTDAFGPVLSTGPTRAVPSTGLRRRRQPRRSRQPRTGQALVARPCRRAVWHTTVVSPAARTTSPNRIHTRSVWTRRDYGSGPGSPGLIFVVGLPPVTTPAGLSVAEASSECPLNTALKGEACARNSRHGRPWVHIR